MTSLPAVGLTMYQAMPARCGPPSGLSAVSSAPHSLPLAYITCCMRVSFESGREMTSSWRMAAALNSSRQQPCPAIVSGRRVVDAVALRRVRRSRASPEPGCCCFGGMPYWPRQHLVAEAERRRGRVQRGRVRQRPDDEVVDVRCRRAPDPGFCASSAAFELRKYSVPPFAVRTSSCPATAPARR